MIHLLTANGLTPIGSSRSRLRWEDDVKADLGTMKIHNWKKMVMDREARNRIAVQAKTHKSCSAKRRRRRSINYVLQLLEALFRLFTLLCEKSTQRTVQVVLQELKLPSFANVSM